MKKVFAMGLAVLMVLSLAACGGSLQTREMSVDASGLEELTKVTIGAPKSFSIQENDWNIVFTDEKQNAQVEAYLCYDYDCYDEAQQYAKDGYEGYAEKKFGDFDGYYYISDSGYYVEVYVYLGCVADIDDVYLSFSVSAYDGETDPMEIFKLKDVQKILNSAVFNPPAVEAA